MLNFVRAELSWNGDLKKLPEFEIKNLELKIESSWLDGFKKTRIISQIFKQQRFIWMIQVVMFKSSISETVLGASPNRTRATEPEPRSNPALGTILEQQSLFLILLIFSFFEIVKFNNSGV